MSIGQGVFVLHGAEVGGFLSERIMTLTTVTYHIGKRYRAAM
jgi:hypothetical protein